MFPKRMVKCFLNDTRVSSRLHKMLDPPTNPFSAFVQSWPSRDSLATVFLTAKDSRLFNTRQGREREGGRDLQFTLPESVVRHRRFIYR